jgi:peptidoglycan/xylan/chitin deacetylase (PgdA/CDA1 family)
MFTLLYHNILRAPEGRWPVAYRAVTLPIFERHIHRLRKRLLHPLEAQEALQKGRTPRGTLVTFDDGAAGIEAAAQVLAQYGSAGVAFVCPGALEKGLWFYRLADALTRASRETLDWRTFQLPLREPKEKRNAYNALSKYLFPLPEAERDAQIAEISGLLQPAGETPENLRILDRAGLCRTAETGGMLFANHSWSHPNLTTLPPEELRREIEEADCWLAASGLPTLPWFAFPRGSHNPAVRAAAAKVCSALFGATPYEPEPGVLPRTSLYEMDGRPLRFALKTTLDGRLMGWREKASRES